MRRRRTVFVETKPDRNVLLSYSLNMVLLTFFVAMLSISSQDNQKQKLGFNSLMGGFGMLPGGRSPFRHDPGEDITTETTPFSKGRLDVNKLRAAMTQKGVINGVGIVDDINRITITLRADVIFEDGSDRLLPGADRKLDAIAELLRGVDNNIVITGHTDSRPLENSPFGSNWGFSSARAMRVLRYFSNHGIGMDRLCAYGMGSREPITSNENAAGRRLNQRVEVVVMGYVSGSQTDQARRLNQIKAGEGRWNRYRAFNLKLGER